MYKYYINKHHVSKRIYIIHLSTSEKSISMTTSSLLLTKYEYAKIPSVINTLINNRQREMYAHCCWGNSHRLVTSPITDSVPIPKELLKLFVINIDIYNMGVIIFSSTTQNRRMYISGYIIRRCIHLINCIKLYFKNEMIKCWTINFFFFLFV